MLDDDRAYTQHKTKGKNTKLHSKGSAFIIKTASLPPGEEGTSLERVDARVLRELGFTRQEED